MTSRIEKAALAYIAHIDKLGGMVSAIEQGYVQREIQNAAYAYQIDIEQKRRVIVGQNAFVGEAPPVPLLKIDPRIEREQCERTKAWRGERGDCSAELGAVSAAAKGDENLMPLIIAAVKAGATVGEIAGVMREQWGEYQEVLTV